MMEQLILRAVERGLGVLIGGFAILLGYLLFLKLPEHTDSSGKIVLPGGVNIFLSRVGPGIFFSLFGAALVALSLYQQLEIKSNPGVKAEGQNDTAPAGAISVRYFGSGNDAASQETLDAMRSEARRTVFELNHMGESLRPGLAPAKQLDVEQAIRESKVALVQSVWARDWGEFAQFKNWVNQGEPAPVPKGFNSAAVELFRNGQPQKNQ